MTGRILTVNTLVALAQAKAIITNNCPQGVYLWSVPSVGSAHTNNLPVSAGSRYEEPWRLGTPAQPGIALKISSQPNGIYQGKDEIEFAYTIDKSDKSKVWVDLSPVRGTALNEVAFYTCQGTTLSIDSPTQQCSATDDIELVLCGGQRTSPGKDMASLQRVANCYDYHHDNSKYDNDSSNDCTEYCSDNDDDDDEDQDKHSKHTLSSSKTVYLGPKAPHSSTKASCTTCHSPQATSVKPSHEPPKYTSHTAGHTTTKTLTWQTTVIKPAHEHTVTESGQEHTVTEHKTVTKPEQHYTEAYKQPPQHTLETKYKHPHHPSEMSYKPPQYISTKPYDHPKDGSKEHHDSPEYKSQPPYTPPHATSNAYKPPKSTSEHEYPAPPRYTSEKWRYSPNKPMTTHHYAPDYTADPYQYPQKDTSDYTRPESKKLRPSTTYAEDHYSRARPSPYGRHGASRRSTSGKSHDYCMPRIISASSLQWQLVNDTLLCSPGCLVHPPSSRAEKGDNPLIQGQSVGTKPLKEVVHQQVTKTEKCILPFCHPVQLGLDCDAIKRAFEQAEGGGVDWVQNGKPCSDMMDARNGTQIPGLTYSQLFNTADASQDTVEKICVKPLCEDLDATDVACDILKLFLEVNAKNHGVKIDYTTDGDVCNKSTPFGEIRLRRAVGMMVSMPLPAHGKRAEDKVCAKEVCKKFSLSTQQCNESMRRAKKNAKMAHGVDIDFTTNGPVCDSELTMLAVNSTSLSRGDDRSSI